LEITDWIDDGTTAMCPKCDVDSVIGSAAGFPIERKFLSSMHSFWFDRSFKVDSKVKE
jgi:hypothetical protein